MIDGLLSLAAQHVTFFDAGLAALILIGLLLRRRHATVVWWAISTCLMLGLSFALARASSVVYADPRAVTTIHLKPLAPLASFLPHLQHNSFPSSHAVLTGVIVSSVLFLSRRWTIPLMVLGALDTWVRMGVGPHQAVDILGGWVIVALATVLAYFAGAVVAAVVLPSIPPRWTAERVRLRLNFS